jgi:hypothetical protein
MRQNSVPEDQQFPKSYTGDNIQQLAKHLDTKKEDFESTQQYQERLAQIAPPGKTYLFFCAELPLALEYNADSQEFIFFRISYEPNIPVVKIEKEGKPYIGTNAFGVTKKIRKLKIKKYEINDQDWQYDAGVAFKYPCPANKAALIKKDLAIALLIELTPHRHFGAKYNHMTSPFIYTDTYFSEPTVNRPLEYASDSYALTANIKSVILYRKTDRSILLIAKPSKQK